MIQNSFRRIALAQGLLPERPMLMDFPDAGLPSENRSGADRNDDRPAGRPSSDFWLRFMERTIQV